MSDRSSKTAEPLKLIAVGEGGQGIQTIAKLLARSAFGHGYFASYIPNFGTEQRGGLSLAFVQLSRSPIMSPKFKYADVFVLASKRNTERSLRYIAAHTNVIYDRSLVDDQTISLMSRTARCLIPVNAFELATSEFPERAFNIILLGIIAGLIDRSLEADIIGNMATTFNKYYVKDPSLKGVNDSALKKGIELATAT